VALLLSLLCNVLLLLALWRRGEGCAARGWLCFRQAACSRAALPLSRARLGAGGRAELLRAKALALATEAQLEARTPRRSAARAPCDSQRPCSQAAAASLRDAHAALGTAASVRAAKEALTGAPCAGNSSAPAWLVIGIPTLPRRGGADYLTPTLLSLLSELPSPGLADPFGPQAVRVVVMSMAQPGEHPVFEAAQRRFGADAKAAAYISFEQGGGAACDDVAPDAAPVDDLHNPKNLPGPEVRRQTCHLTSLLDAAGPRGAHYLFMEDDFDTCGHALRALQYAAAKAYLRAPEWLALRVSYGMNGILMRAADVAPLTAYLRAHVARLPPDLLWREWATLGGRGRAAPGPKGLRRPMLVYRQNLFSHTGDVSTFAVRPARKTWPACFAPMAKVWSLGRKEQFDARRCAEEDLSPCDRLSITDADWATRLPLFGVADDGTPP
jgi:hypothetical protein